MIKLPYIRATKITPSERIKFFTSSALATWGWRGDHQQRGDAVLRKMKVGGEKTRHSVQPPISCCRAAHQEAHLNYPKKVHKQRGTDLLRKIQSLSHLLSVHLKSLWWMIQSLRIWEANFDLILMPHLFTSAQNESVLLMWAQYEQEKEKEKDVITRDDACHQVPSFHQCHRLPQSRFGVSGV